MKLITETHAKDIRSTLSCYDRIVVQGTLHPFRYAEGMTSFLKSKRIRIFDYKEFAKGLRDTIITNAEQIAKDNNLEIEYITKKNFRKENRISGIIKERGDHPGLVHIFSALEPCSTAYMPGMTRRHTILFLYTITVKDFTAISVLFTKHLDCAMFPARTSVPST